MTPERLDNLRTVRLALALALLAAAGCSKKEPAETQAQEKKPLLREKLAAFRREFVKSAPKERVKVFQRGIDRLRASGVAFEALTVGDPAVMFELPNAKDEAVSLERLLADGPVVIVWFRGGWCPYCNITLHAMQDALPEIRKLGATLVAISPQMPESTADTTNKNRLTFDVLSDVGNEVAKAYGLVYTLPEDVAGLLEEYVNLERCNGDLSCELPLAATYVVDREGIIRFAFLDADYRNRAEPADVVAALKRLND